MDDLINLKGLLFGVKKKSILVLLFNAISTLLMLFLHIAMARILGHENYSDYSYVITILTVLALINTLGFETSAQRFLPVFYAKSNWSLLKGFIVQSFKVVILLSIFLGIFSSLFLLSIKDMIRPELLKIFWIGILALPPTSLILLSTGILKGLKNPIFSTLPKLIIRPLLILLIVLTAAYYKFEVNGFHAMTIDVIISTFALICGIILINQSFSKKIKNVNSQSLLKEWISISVGILAISLMQLLIRSNDVIILGVFSGTEVSGPYSVASRIALLAGFGLIAINTVIPAIISKYFAEKNLNAIQIIATMSARLNFIFSIIVAIVIIFMNEYILNFFGSEFIQASSALTILCSAQIVNSLTGSVGFILIMTGHQKELSKILLKTFFIHIILCFLLIPALGIDGAAIATALTIIISNLLLAIRCYNKAKIDPSIFGFQKVS